ncbi:hypothetical protein SCOR_27470 [Sulfidibacter corallicola]
MLTRPHCDRDEMVGLLGLVYAAWGLVQTSPEGASGVGGGASSRGFEPATRVDFRDHWPGSQDLTCVFPSATRICVDADILACCRSVDWRFGDVDGSSIDIHDTFVWPCLSSRVSVSWHFHMFDLTAPMPGQVLSTLLSRRTQGPVPSKTRVRLGKRQQCCVRPCQCSSHPGICTNGGS